MTNFASYDFTLICLFVSSNGASGAAVAAASAARAASAAPVAYTRASTETPFVMLTER